MAYYDALIALWPTLPKATAQEKLAAANAARNGPSSSARVSVGFMARRFQRRWPG
jgi:hypothetical protein